MTDDQITALLGRLEAAFAKHSAGADNLHYEARLTLKDIQEAIDAINELRSSLSND